MKVEERAYTLTETAKMLNVSRETLRRWIHRKKLPAMRITDRVWRIHPKVVATLLGQTKKSDKNVRQDGNAVQQSPVDENKSQE